MFIVSNKEYVLYRKEQHMNVGEFYRHKFNKYVSKVTKVGRGRVELETLNSGVTEFIARENFNLNYEPVTTIYQFRKDVENEFDFGKISLMGDTIRVDVDDSRIEFSIYDEQLKVQFTDDIKEAVESDTNIMYFLLEDTFEVITMLASLFTD